MRTFSAVLLIAFASAVLSQTPEQQFHPRVPTVTFDLIWEEAVPQEYTIRTQADGPSTYVSRNPLKPVQPGEEKEPDYTLDFTMSAANQRKTSSWPSRRITSTVILNTKRMPSPIPAKRR